MDDKELKHICTEFRKGMLGRNKSDLKCAMVSWALQGFLSYSGQKTKICESVVGDLNHLWLRLPDGRVIDCTADQFNNEKRKFPKVYIGRPQDIHVECYSSSNASGKE